MSANFEVFEVRGVAYLEEGGRQVGEIGLKRSTLSSATGELLLQLEDLFALSFASRCKSFVLVLQDAGALQVKERNG